MNLTNEDIKDLFDNNFTLANYAISLAKEQMAKGESVTLMEILKMLEHMAKEKESAAE